VAIALQPCLWRLASSAWMKSTCGAIVGTPTAIGLWHTWHPYVPCSRYQGDTGGDPDGLPLPLRPAWNSQAANAGPARLQPRLCGASLGRGCFQVQSSCRSLAIEPLGGAYLWRQDRGYLCRSAVGRHHCAARHRHGGVGRGDHSYWLYGLDIMPENGPPPGDKVNVRPEMINVRDNVHDLCMKHNVKYLWDGSPNPKDAGYVLNAIELGNDA
jgi:hypothetical protein